ncbi:MAG: response regulator transcription factor [Stackebrandtia sp.]
MIRVLLADDQALVRGALASLLRIEPDIDVVGEAASGDAVLDVAQRTEPDIALLDVHMPGKDGIAVAAELREKLPRCQVIICTTFGRPGYLARALASGAAGFIVKDAPPEHLVDAIRRVHTGLRVIDPALATESLYTGPNPLTQRERDVLRAAAEGGTVADIAKTLHVSKGTVRNHLSAAIGKTGSRTRAEAAHLAETNGWL